jgi:NAD(P)-dependent dehydrogenase (short-subunit alcohol dehydrogenase family)
MNILVTGASRGIGLEFVSQYLDRGDTVLAAARNPEAEPLAALSRRHAGRLRCLLLDVTRDDHAQALAAAVPGPLDILINNAGVMERPTALADVDLEKAAEVYAVNALGPLRVTRALLPALRRGQGKRVLHLSSGLGSISDNTSGGFYGYRMAKAALNMASRCLAHELRPLGILSAALSPGWVQTDMGGSGAALRVEDSVAALIRVIDKLTLSDSGGFFHYDGSTFPW